MTVIAVNAAAVASPANLAGDDLTVQSPADALGAFAAVTVAPGDRVAVITSMTADGVRLEVREVRSGAPWPLTDDQPTPGDVLIVTGRAVPYLAGAVQVIADDGTTQTANLGIILGVLASMQNGGAVPPDLGPLWAQLSAVNQQISDLWAAENTPDNAPPWNPQGANEPGVVNAATPMEDQPITAGDGIVHVSPDTSERNVDVILAAPAFPPRLPITVRHRHDNGTGHVVRVVEPVEGGDPFVHATLTVGQWCIVATLGGAWEVMQP